MVWISLYYSYRVTQYRSNLRDEAAALHTKGGFILACWHEHLIMASMAQKGLPFRPLASRSLSGRVMGFVLDRFGFKCIYGSQSRNGKNKGGAESRQILKQAVVEGYPSAFTVDGSTGPRRVVKPGVVWLAKETQAMIVPVAAVAESFWELKTWDRLKIPKPFSKIHVVYGDFIIIPSSLSEEEFSQKQEEVKVAINICEKEASKKLFFKKSSQLKKNYFSNI